MLENTEGAIKKGQYRKNWQHKVQKTEKTLCMKINLFLHCNFCTLKHCVYRIMYV